MKEPAKGSLGKNLCAYSAGKGPLQTSHMIEQKPVEKTWVVQHVVAAALPESEFSGLWPGGCTESNPWDDGALVSEQNLFAMVTTIRFIYAIVLAFYLLAPSIVPHSAYFHPRWRKRKIISCFSRKRSRIRSVGINCRPRYQT